jgi:hypothetical protein
MEKLITTSMIGYLNRCCDEWHVPDDIPVIPVYDYIDNPNKMDEYTKDWGELTEKTKEKLKENEEWMKKRIIVKEFLEELFQYNPDAHVRSSYKPNTKDLERQVIKTPAAMLSIDELKRKNIKFKNEMVEFDRVQKLRVMKEQKNEKLDEKLDQLVGKQLLLPEYHYSTMDFDKWTDEDKNLLRNVTEMIPPADIYGKFKNYLETNYDKLREAVLHLYCDKPDFDMAIIPYQWHDNKEDANEFQKIHKDEVISDIITAQKGKWNLFAPFEKVREGTRFFNENTTILEEIAEQLEKDQKLGADMMKKRVKKKKKKNVEEYGPDAEAFKKWKSKNEILTDKGAIDISEEKEEDDDIPSNAVQVDIWKATSTGKMEKTKMFTKAEEPKSLK